MRYNPAIRWPSIRAFLAGALFLSCDGSPTEREPATVASMDVVSGNHQVDTVGTELAAPLVVKVVDTEGQPFPGQLVNFRVVAGGGSVFAGSSITNAEGIARERWTLGTTAGDTQRVEARAINNETGEALRFAIFTAVGTPDVPASITKTRGDAQTGALASVLSDSLAVRVADRFGNAVSGVSVQWAANGGSISPTTSSTDATGTARASWTLGPTLGQQSANAAIPSVSPGIFSATATAGAPARIAIIVQPSDSIITGDTLPRQPVVQLMDAFGNATTNQGWVITAAIASGGGELQGPITASTDANGRASFSNLAISGTPGLRTLSFSAPGITAATSAPVKVGPPGPPAVLSVVVEPSSDVWSGQVLPRQPVVQIVDAKGHAVQAAGVVVSAVRGSGSGLVFGQTSVATDANGKAVFTNLSFGAIGGYPGFELIFTAPGLASDTSELNVNLPSTPATIEIVEGENQRATVGTAVPIPPAVRVLDAQGQPVPGAVVYFEPLQLHGVVSGGTQIADAQGIARVGSWKLGDIADRTNKLVAFTPVSGASVEVVIEAYALAPASGTAELISGPDSTHLPYDTINLAILLKGNDGQPLVGHAVAWGVSGERNYYYHGTYKIFLYHGAVAADTTYTDANGIARNTWFLAGSAHRQKSFATPAPLNGLALRPEQLAFGANVIPGAPSNYHIDTPPYGYVNSTVTLAAQLRDKGGNYVRVAGRTVTWSKSGTGEGTFASPTSVTDAMGIARVNYTLGSVGQRYNTFSVRDEEGLTDDPADNDHNFLPHVVP